MWHQIDNSLQKEFEFTDFEQALVFVNKVGELAQQMNHHPDMFLHNYNKVRVTLSTHETGGVSEKDIQLSQKIDRI